MPNQEEQELTLDRALWYGRMCRAHSASTAEEISPQFLKRLQKSQVKKSPIFLSLRTGGLIQDVSWEEDSALRGEFSTHSFLEYHNGGVESRLSQILQGGQLRKYYLSDAAKMGILRRANRRGKDLPIILQEALQAHLRRDSFGQTQIADTGKILFELWSKIGTQTFIEWVRRTAILVQSEKILLCWLREQTHGKTENGKSCTFCKNEQTESEECYTGCPMRYLWQEVQDGCSPQGQESNEQLAGQLSAFVQELSCQTTPKKVFMCCLRNACERSQSLQQALASMETELETWLGYRIHSKDQGNTADSTGTASERLNPWDVQSKSIYSESSVCGTLCSGKTEGVNIQPCVMQSVCYPINTMVATRDNAESRTTFGVGEDGDAQFTLSAAHEHAVCYSKSTKPHSADEAPTITESDVSPTLNTFDCGEERTNTYVVESSIAFRGGQDIK